MEDLGEEVESYNIELREEGDMKVVACSKNEGNCEGGKVCWSCGHTAAKTLFRPPTLLLFNSVSLLPVFLCYLFCFDHTFT